MNDKIFRKKSIDKMSSPEQLNDYIKVTNPGVWTILAAIAILLVGICVWGIFGKLETKLTVAAESRGGQTVLYVKETDVAAARKAANFSIGDTVYAVTSVAASPIAVTEEIDEYARHMGGLALGEWVYVVQTDAALAEGSYQAQIVVDSVSPLFFVLN